MLRVFLNGFKNIPGKVCVNRVHNNDAFVNVGNYIVACEKNTAYFMRSVLSADKTPHTNEECLHRILIRRSFINIKSMT